ncbi:MAG: methyltransferase domain-containing protein [Methylococcales bacterium]|nr:methyltransferase domain-containing protein [Methylococcales bacterium]
MKKSIDISCQQTVLQIGALGFEDDYMDCDLYKRFTILDNFAEGTCLATKIQAKAFNLPIQSESIDMIILPHLLEFDAHRFQSMREIERVLKPEGHLIILNFNPWSIWLRSQYVRDKRLAESWRGHFISRSRILDWLKLLNFELKTTTEFEVNSFKTHRNQFSVNKNTLLATAYAINAVKRRYTLIPLAPARVVAPMRLNVATPFKINSTDKRR